MSAAEVTNEIADAIERAGLHPAHAFAVRQCGFLVTEIRWTPSATTSSTSGKAPSTGVSRCIQTPRDSAEVPGPDCGPGGSGGAAGHVRVRVVGGIG